MLNIAFAFNLNIQRCEIEVGEEKPIIEGYKKLLYLLVKHNIKANFFITGFTSETLAQLDPAFLDVLRSKINKTIKLGTYTYTHPVPQLLCKEEFTRQIHTGIQLDQKYYGKKTVGFLPPEFAYTNEMAKVLCDEGIEYFVALASQIEKAIDGKGLKTDAYHPYIVNVKNDNRKLIAVSAAYQLPGVPARFFKLMMKGLLPVSEVIKGITNFRKEHENALLLFKRDGETIFIDSFNSGFEKTYEVMDSFLDKLSKLSFINSVWIEDVIKNDPPKNEIELPDYLGNTKIETYTEGEAKEIWILTRQVRDALIKAEKEGFDKEKTEKAWKHLLLSHNSDGRIGYWFSKWNPGEHKVAPSRKAFVLDNLKAAIELLR